MKLAVQTKRKNEINYPKNLFKDLTLDEMSIRDKNLYNKLLQEYKLSEEFSLNKWLAQNVDYFGTLKECLNIHRGNNDFFLVNMVWVFYQANKLFFSFDNFEQIHKRLNHIYSLREVSFSKETIFIENLDESYKIINKNYNEIKENFDLMSSFINDLNQFLDKNNTGIKIALDEYEILLNNSEEIYDDIISTKEFFKDFYNKRYKK